MAAAFAVAAMAAAPALAAEDASPPGSNDFRCRPTPRHPRPLVLVHGLGARQTENWSYLSPILHDAGYCVFSLTYGVDPRSTSFPYVPGGVVRMEDSAPELATFVKRVLAKTHASKVDLVGHSEGTVMPRYYLERLGGARRVRHFVALTPLWRGTELGGFAELRDAGAQNGLSAALVDLVAGFCGSCPEFVKGSEYLNDLNADGERVPGVVHTNIATRYDELVQPYTSGLMSDGGTNIVLQDVCPSDVSEHAMVAYDPNVARLVLNALDPAHAKPVAC